MRFSAIVSMLVLGVASGFVTFQNVVGSEAGLTAGTPVLTAAELRAMAPDPLPVVADPATAVNVTPKGVAQAEELTQRAVEERAAKAAAKKKAAKKSDAKKSAAKKSDAKKSAAKKTAAKTDKKSDRKADKKSDAKVAAKKDAKKKDLKAKDAKSAPSKDKLAKKDSKKSDAKSKDKSKEKAPKVAAKPAKPAKPTKPVRPVHVAMVEDAEEAGDEDESDELELAPAPKSKPTKSAAKPAAKTAVKPTAKAKAPLKTRKPVALASDEAPQQASDEAAEATASAVDPSVICPEDQAKFHTRISTWLKGIAALDAAGSADVQLKGMHYGKVQGRDAVIFDSARLKVAQAKFQTVHVKKGTLELRELALDAAQLKSGACALVGTPTVVPDLTLEHAQVQGQLGKNNIKSPNIAYEGDQMVFTGKAPFMFFSIPFKMAGKFERNGNNVAFRISDLQIRGSAASADRLAQVQGRLETMIKLEAVLTPIGAPGAPVRGGRVSIEDGASVVYSTPIDRAVLAE